jgi:hypothetical protein
MSLGALLRLFFCIFTFGVYLYAYVEKQNQLTELRLEIPTLMKEVRIIKEENAKLHYEIKQFESPAKLMQLLEKPEYAHLKHPFQKNIIILERADTIDSSGDESLSLLRQEEELYQ